MDNLKSAVLACSPYVKWALWCGLTTNLFAAYWWWVKDGNDTDALVLFICNAIAALLLNPLPGAPIINRLIRLTVVVSVSGVMWLFFLDEFPLDKIESALFAVPLVASAAGGTVWALRSG